MAVGNRGISNAGRDSAAQGLCVQRKGTGWAAISRVREAGMRRTSLGLRLKGAKVKQLLCVSWQPSRIDPLQGEV